MELRVVDASGEEGIGDRERGIRSELGVAGRDEERDWGAKDVGDERFSGTGGGETAEDSREAVGFGWTSGGGEKWMVGLSKKVEDGEADDDSVELDIEEEEVEAARKRDGRSEADSIREGRKVWGM
jgi:hypothetical protein